MSRQLLLNLAPVAFADKKVGVELFPYQSEDQLRSLRNDHRRTHFAQRYHGTRVITIPTVEDAPSLGGVADETLQLLKSDLDAVAPGRAALRLTALGWVSRSACTVRLDRPTIPQLAQLLRRVPQGLAQWTWEEKPRTSKGEARRWHVDNEYHVQNLLWFLLSPLFPDLKPEEYTPTVGTYQPRADLGIPSLRVIVEAKFWRKSVRVEKLIEEIAADSSIYFVAGSPYAVLIPFIWDNDRRTEDHESLISGLKQLPHIDDAVVVARPGLMETVLGTTPN